MAKGFYPLLKMGACIKPKEVSRSAAGPGDRRGEGFLREPVWENNQRRMHQMVLSLMRRHAKSWLIKFLIGIIAVVFIFYFGYSFTAREGLKIAKVNGEVITGMEYQKAYEELLERFRAQYKDLLTESLIKSFDLKNRALEILIDQKLVSQEARRLGLDVTEEEVQKAIMEYPPFQVGGKFDIGRYRALLQHNRMKPEDFEADMARGLLEGKVREFLSSFVTVTDQEVLDQYTYANERMKISFVRFKPDEFKKSINPDDAAVGAFFEEHKEDYRVPEKIKLAYLLVDPAGFRDRIEVGEEEVKEHYGYHLAAFQEQEQVRARHILFKVDENAPDEEVEKVRKKAEEVLEKARKGEDFAALAKEYSEGPTKAKGGDLGYFSEGQMVKPFEEAVFGMKKGEISNLVRTRFGFHIIKVEDIKEARTKPLDEVREEIRKDIVETRSVDLAHEKALSILDQMPYDADLVQIASKHGLEVKYTDLFSDNETIPGIGGDEKLRQSLFSLEKMETSELLEVGGKFYIFQVADKKASFLPELKEVAEKTKKDLIDDLANEEAKAAAERYLARLKKGEAWAGLAKEKNLKVEETEFFTRRGSIPMIGYQPDLQETVFSLGKDNPYPDEVFETQGGAVVIRWEDGKGIDEKKYEEEKEQYRFALMKAKQRRASEKWLQFLKKHAEVEKLTTL